MDTSESGIEVNCVNALGFAARSASFVAGDTLKGNVDMRSPRGARVADARLGQGGVAAAVDAPAPPVGARKASAVSNVI